MTETMGSSTRIVIITIFLLIWYSLNLYLGWRGWHYFGSYLSGNKVIYWSVLLFASSAYFMGRWGNHHYPGNASDALIWVGCIGWHLCFMP